MVGQSLLVFLPRSTGRDTFRSQAWEKGEEKKDEMTNVTMKKVRADAEFSGGHFGAKIMEIEPL
jgi:hypothetical protein